MIHLQRPQDLVLLYQHQGTYKQNICLQRDTHARTHARMHDGPCFKTTTTRQSTQWWAMFQDNKKKAVHTKMGHVSRQQEEVSPHKDEPCFQTTRRSQSTQRWTVSRQQEESSPHKMGHVSRQQEKGSPRKDGPGLKTTWGEIHT